MTINELRKKFPSKDFLFFKDGLSVDKTPFLYQKIKGFKEKENSVFINL